MNKYYAIMETEADNMNKFSLGTNIFMATAIGFYALQIVDAIFWTEGENQAIDISGFKPEDKVSLSIAPDAYSINVSLNLKFNLFK
jgi:hypothetical protein